MGRQTQFKAESANKNVGYKGADKHGNLLTIHAVQRRYALRLSATSMTSPEAIRMHFAGYPFGDPCSEAVIERAESILKERLPSSLRELYLAFDGFYGPALASFFWPLFTTADRPGYGLVEMNRDLREDQVSGYPPLVSECLFFGGNERYWGIKRDLPDSIIEWDAYLDGFQIVGSTPLEVWLAEKRCYDELDNDRNAQPP